MSRRPRHFLLLEVLLAGLLAAGTIGLMLNNLQAARVDHRAALERRIVERALETAAVEAALLPERPVQSADPRVSITVEEDARDAQGCVSTTLSARGRKTGAEAISTVVWRCR